MAQNKIKQAVILSAGFGTRLKTLFPDTPKVMVPFAGKPLLEHHINRFKRAGVNEFFVNLHYLPESIKNYFGDGSKFGVKITYAYEPVILGTAGGVKDFDGQFNENFFVIYGDIYSEVDYTAMAEEYFKHTDPIGMELIGKNDHPKDSDLVDVDENLKFLKLYLKPHAELPKTDQSMRGIYVFNRKLVSYIPKDTYYEIDHNLLPEVLAKGYSFYGYKTGDFLKDTGTPERYQFVEDRLVKKQK